MDRESYPRRKRLRHRGYDYSLPGDYFITVCVADRRCILGTVTQGHTALSAAGKTVEQGILQISAHHPGVTVEPYIIMPNHVHMIITLPDRPEDGKKPTVSTVVAGFKAYTSRVLGYPIWQRGFYDRILIDEREYRLAAEYIEANPAQWESDRYRIQPGHTVGTG